MLTLLSFPPALGIRSLSPFSYKAEALLVMSELEHEVVPGDLGDPNQAPLGKLPVLRDGDQVIPDSCRIQAYLESRYGIDFDPELTTIDKAVAEAFRRLVEDHLYWVLVYSRWCEPENEGLMIDAVFGDLPERQRRAVFDGVRSTYVKSLFLQGIGRHDAETIYEFGRQDLDSLAHYLDDKPFFFGDLPSSFDALLAGLLLNVLGTPMASPLKAHAEAIPDFAAFVERFERTVFGDAAMLPLAA